MSTTPLILKNPRGWFAAGAEVEDSIKRQVTQHLMAVQIRSQAEVEEAERRAEEAAQAMRNVQYHHADPDEALAQAPAEGAEGEAAGAPAAEPVQPFVHSSQNGRPQRPLPMRLGQEVQELPRQALLRGSLS